MIYDCNMLNSILISEFVLIDCRLEIVGTLV